MSTTEEEGRERGREGERKRKGGREREMSHMYR